MALLQSVTVPAPTPMPPVAVSVDDLVLGEILMSLKRDSEAAPVSASGSCLSATSSLNEDSVKKETAKMAREGYGDLTVQVHSPSSLPPPPTHDGTPTGAALVTNPADVFNLDSLSAVSPMASRIYKAPALATTRSPRAGTPGGSSSSKRYGPVVQLEDLRQCFNMPIAAVARKFGICATLLKKICRRHGIQRWPHRQIRSLQKSIDMLRESLSVAKGTNKEYIAKKIAAFEYTLECIMKDPNTAAKGISAGRLASPSTEELVKRGNRAKSRKKATSPSAPALSDDEDGGSFLSSSSRSPTTTGSSTAARQDWTAVLASDSSVPGASAPRLVTRRASVPMSLQSILC